MKKQRIPALLCAAALLAALAGCGAQSESAGSADAQTTSLVGQITAMTDTSITLQLGSLTEGQAPGSEMPSGEAPSGEMPSGEAPSGEMPDGEAPGGEMPSGEAPSGEMPDGEAPSGEMPDGEAPSGEMPSGEAPGGEMPSGEAPGGQGGGFTAGEETVTLNAENAVITGADGESLTLADLTVGTVVTATVDGENNALTLTVAASQGGQGGQGGFGGSGQVTQGTAANTISADGTYTGEQYTSAGDDENALRVDGATVTLTDVTVDKASGSSSNTEDGDFYGMNAALLATNGAQLTITGATVTSSAQNGNGVFSYGEGTVVNISDSTIVTTADNSGGIQTTGGGTTNAADLTVETSGNSSAAIRSDRGGGTVQVDGGSYTSNGYNSPAVYSTAEITVANATLTANHSEALVIEGQNSIALTDCTVTGNMSDTQGASSSENVHTVMIYQSMSGDAEVGTSRFSMTGGSLTGQNGDLFYVTNTHCVLTLSGVSLVQQDADGCLLRVAGNSGGNGWGTAGANGAQVEFTADSQVLTGDIVVDTVSTLTLTLQNGSSFTGTVNIIDNAEGGAAVADNAVVTVAGGCTWTLTGDCTLTSLTNNGTIDYNGYTITLADGTVLSA